MNVSFKVEINQKGIALSLPTNKLVLGNLLSPFPQHLLGSACWLELSKPSKALMLLLSMFLKYNIQRKTLVLKLDFF